MLLIIKKKKKKKKKKRQKSGPCCSIFCIDNYYFCAFSKTSISINKYMKKAGEPENDAGLPKHIEGLAPEYFALIIIIVVHVYS